MAPSPDCIQWTASRLRHTEPSGGLGTPGFRQHCDELPGRVPRAPALSGRLRNPLGSCGLGRSLDSAPGVCPCVRLRYCSQGFCNFGASVAKKQGHAGRASDTGSRPKPACCRVKCVLSDACGHQRALQVPCASGVCGQFPAWLRPH